MYVRRAAQHAARALTRAAARRSRPPGRPRRVSIAHTASAGALRGAPELWADADVCPYVAPCRAALAPLDIQARPRPRARARRTRSAVRRLTRGPHRRRAPHTQVAFAPVPAPLLAHVVRGQIEAAFNPPEQEWGTRLLPGLAESVEGFTPAFGASLFGAAAAFRRAGAWAALPATAPLRVQYRIALEGVPGAADAGALSARVTSYVVRTGGGPGSADGHGFSIYAQLPEALGALAAAAAAAAAGEEAGALEPGPDAPTRGQSLVFVGPAEMPFGDLDAVEAEGWPLGPGDDNLPLFTKVCLAEPGAEGEQQGEAAGAGEGPSLEVSRPELLELQAFELTLAALTALAGSGDLAPEGAGAAGSGCAAAGGAAVRVTTHAARGQPEQVLVSVQALPPDGGPAESADAADAYL
jgi:hypothetical protein